MKGFFATAAAALMLATASALPTNSSSTCSASCDRACMSDIVDQILASMVAHNTDTLPLAPVYRATENSHPASLDFMTLWRTVTKADGPDLLAIDTVAGSAYFSLTISEGNDATPAVLLARIKVVAKQISELEFFINRSRGDHGYSLSPEELPTNYAKLMSPPADRTVASRAELSMLSGATFNPNSTFNVTVGDGCQFTEEGWHVVDLGTDGDWPAVPLNCSFPTGRPADAKARLNLVLDEVNGFVVTGGVIYGHVYPYGPAGNQSAFIPDDLKPPQVAQDEWFALKNAEGGLRLLNPTAATGDSLQVLQYYNGKLQAQQINVYLSGPGMTSPWLE